MVAGLIQNGRRLQSLQNQRRQEVVVPFLTGDMVLLLPIPICGKGVTAGQSHPAL